MEPQIDIFVKVNQYLDKKISFQELEDWIVDHLFYFIYSPNNTAKDLAGIIELSLAEMSNGHLSEEEFRERIHNFIMHTSTIIYNLSNQWADSGMSSHVTHLSYSIGEAVSSSFEYK